MSYELYWFLNIVLKNLKILLVKKQHNTIFVHSCKIITIKIIDSLRLVEIGPFHIYDQLWENKSNFKNNLTKKII